MRVLWKIVRGFLVFIGFTVVALAVAGAISATRERGEPMPARAVLALSLYGTPQDEPVAPRWVDYFVPPEPSLSEVVEALHRGAADKRVTAFAARLAGGDYRWADVQELRAAIAAFRAAGKKTYVFAESYGDLYPGMAEYYLASAFDEIWVQPVGTVTITGFHAEVPYFKETLDRLGVTADILQKGDYKTAPESALREGMSEEQRATLHGIFASMMTDFFNGVAEGRKIPAARLGQLIDGAPYTADEAKERNLVDRVGYMDELIAQLVPDEKDERQGLVNAIDYLYEADRAPLNQILKEEKKLADTKRKNGSVALVYVSGLIISGDPYGEGPLMGERMAFADDISGAITQAALDDDIAAIILRVDSPGGSPSASEAIRRSVDLARQKGKYVVVSMGSEAASGGYWVSVDADRIYAQDGTLTGSIGVFGGKAVFAGLSEKIGVNWESVAMGGNADLWSPVHPYSDEGRAAVNRMLDDVYDAFIARVAKGRDFSPEVVEAMAGGRVWTGRQAKERGLIDEIGGLYQAMEDVAKKTGAAHVRDLDIILMPEPPEPMEEILSLFASSGQVREWFKPLTQAIVLQRNPSWSLVRMPSYQDVWRANGF